ncbi:membrane integrity-associated transporter subunit PqiC [bacterium]|nr:membrane integrity-associated transporter subunit PqiC [bacterium]MBU1990765.1 membrane integrity-associated transporter subunit PqiC [bacterium]
MRLVYLGFVVFMFLGCTTSIPPITDYRIQSKIPSIEVESNSCSEISLKVQSAFSSNSIMSQNMNYAQGAHKQYSYTQAQWSESPNRAISSEVVKLLRELHLFKTIQTSKSISKNKWLLETNIEDFMQYFNKDATSSYANVVMTLSIIDSMTSQVIATKTFSSRVQTESLNAQGGVKALNEALFNVLSQSAEWLREVCR